MNIRITDIEGLKPSFTQWDVDRVLLISGCDSQPCLRFDNPELMRSLVLEAEADGANWKCLVPNFMLQFAGPMVVSVFVQPDEGKTVFTAMYPVVPAKKPQDYTYEENIGYVNWVEKSEEAQELLDDIAALREEIQSAAETATSASEAAVAAAEDIDETVAAALQTAKESGDFDGADGQDGQNGAPGPKGDPGEDGVSPRFSSTAITGGHRVTVQDAYGEYTFDVMDGADGQDGQDGQDGAPGQDGADGSGVWFTTGRISGDDNPFVIRRDLIGRQGATVQVHDLLFAPDVRDEGEPTTLYEITSVGTACALKRLCKMQGEDGGGGVTVDDALSATSENPVQNKVVKAALDEKANASDVPTKTSDLQNDSGFITASGAAAAAPVQSVNGQTGTVSLSIPTVPTNVSAFANDAGYLTESTVAASADNWLGDALYGIDAENVPVILYDGQNGVYIRRRPQDLADAFLSQLKMNFALVVPPNYNSYPVLFTPSKFDKTKGELHLTGIVGGVLYEATLLPGLDPIDNDGIAMVGTMTTTNLALPSAQGVSF